MTHERSHGVDGTPLLAFLTFACALSLGLFAPDRPGSIVAGSVAFWLVAVLNTPHFLLSLDLFYRHKLRSIPALDFRHHLAAWIFPLAFFALILAAPGTSHGSVLIQNLHRITTLAVLWHFARQSFGVLLLQLATDGRKVGIEFRTSIHAHLLLLAAAQWLFQNTSGQDVTYFSLGFYTLSLPEWMVWSTLAASVYFFLRALQTVVKTRENSSRTPILPSPAWLTLFCTWLWLAPVVQHPLYITLLPAFHSIQHLSFALPLRGKIESAAGRPGWLPLLTLGALLVFGFGLLHGLVPWLDESHPLLGGTIGIQGWQYVMATFFNLHHYTIEHALWSGGKGDLKPVLLRPAQALVNSAG